MTTDERRKFVLKHRMAVFGYGRLDDGPSMSIVYYVADEDKILVSTMAKREKAKAVKRNPKVSLCILDEQWPPDYLQVYCEAELDTKFESALDLSRKISELMAGRELDDSIMPDIEERVRREERVVIRCKPYATFHTPPRHVTNESEAKQLTHSTSTSIPW